MKKFISIIVLIALLFSVACAESDFVISWNSHAKQYGAIEISQEMFSENNGMYVYKSDNFMLILLPSVSGYDKAAIISSDADILLPSAAVLGMCLVDNYDADSLIKFMGYTSYFFTQAKAGKTSTQYLFGSYMYGVEQSDGGYTFAMSKF